MTSRCYIVSMQETPPTKSKIRREGRERATKGVLAEISPNRSQIIGKDWVQCYDPSLIEHALHDIIEKQEPRGAKVFHSISMLDMILNMKSSLLSYGCRLGWLLPQET